ncbi:VCBS repeat-containing protein [Streptomyces sp. WAC01280]|uniref:FG-GAP repeat domain-containing protein n=1 Tax=Streptomyces sp. WAC01280 TaxID=2487424 RepID=UPI0021AF5C2E|nr:VCBS repeat-containing protein [Streptomyces sp. WAC01280]
MTNKTARRRALKGAFVATAIATAIATTAGTAMATTTAEQPLFEMYGIKKSNQEMFVWTPTGTGGFEPALSFAEGAGSIADVIVADNDGDGFGESEWTLYKNGRLDFWNMDGVETSSAGTGWNIYKTVLSPGNVGGAKEADLIGVDAYGVLYSYLSYPNGKLTPRVRVGGGWNAYDQIAGQGDLTGDGKPDIVAKEKATGILYLYKGTGDYKAPFTGRTKIGSGWNAYDRLISVGDMNLDGKADLLARKPAGQLMRYYGTGIAATPFKAPTQIGTGYQAYNLL